MTLIVFALCALCAQGVGQSSASASEERFVFETWNKQKVDAFRGSFKVPENRTARDSREIPIKYVRLAATGGKAGPPIVYLAGGPGGSGIQAINYRYRMFMAMRRHGDVIALDQRGTGDSNVVPECRSAQTLPVTTAMTDRQFAEYHRDALRECLAFWKLQGVDVAGYNTAQSAQDLEALRRHLGAEKIVLWGTSYGSHLALAALREMPGRIDKVVISSVEGLNQTIKLPARSDEYFDRLQAAIDTQPEAKAAYPDIKALLRRVHAKLEREPARIQLNSRDDQKIDYLLQRRDMQMLAAGLVADPRSAAQLLGIYQTIEQGVDGPLDQLQARLLPDHLITAGEPITLEGMPIAMDIASGMTADRRREVSNQAKKAILGNYLDPALLFDGLAPELDLGDAFRAGPVSDVPVLALSGTLDGRTTIDSQREALSGLTNVTMITVENAGHNLFDEDASAIQEAIDLFMRGDAVHAGAIEVVLPDMAPGQSSGTSR
jgi:pimeloyl-ACP methyl ester carboxylesterase